MKLLVITYHFPPDPSIGARRWGGLTKYLARAGAAVHVVTSGPSDSTDVSANGVSVSRLAKRRTLNDRYRAATVRRRTPEPWRGDGLSPGDAESGSGIGSALRRELSLLLSFPDGSRGWALKALGAALRTARDKEVTAVVSSGPPHTSHLIGSVVASLRGLPHVVDLRDPWATYRSDLRVWPGIHSSHLGRFVLPRLERFAFARASMIIANTHRLRDLLRKRYPQAHVEWVPNGVDLEEVGAPSGDVRYPGLSISHTGTLYGGRTLDGVMDAFAAFLSHHPEARMAGSRLRAAGPMEGLHLEGFRSKCTQLGLEDVVELLGIVSPTRAEELARGSSLCLVLAQGQHLQVPGKLYELVAMGCSVLVISEPDSASADEAERLGVRMAPDEPAALLRVLDEVWAGKNLFQPSEGVRGLSYEQIAPDVEDLLTRLVPGR